MNLRQRANSVALCQQSVTCSMIVWVPMNLGSLTSMALLFEVHIASLLGRAPFSLCIFPGKAEHIPGVFSNLRYPVQLGLYPHAFTHHLSRVAYRNFSLITHCVATWAFLKIWLKATWLCSSYILHAYRNSITWMTPASSASLISNLPHLVMPVPKELCRVNQILTKQLPRQSHMFAECHKLYLLQRNPFKWA